MLENLPTAQLVEFTRWLVLENATYHEAAAKLLENYAPETVIAGVMELLETFSEAQLNVIAGRIPKIAARMQQQNTTCHGKQS